MSEGVAWLQDDDPLSDGLAAMERRGAGSMLVRSSDGRPSGIVRKWEAASRLDGGGRGLTVADATSPWRAVSAAASLDSALAALRDEQFGRLPVVDDVEVVGTITREHIRRYRELEGQAGGPEVLERLERAPRPPADLANLVGFGSFDVLGLEHLIQLRQLVN